VKITNPNKIKEERNQIRRTLNPNLFKRHLDLFLETQNKGKTKCGPMALSYKS
jgi:hypothetical protein